MQNNVPQPMFAPASQNAAQVAEVDDFDLNEIFAEYFINEFDDPMNAYTNSMANYSGSAPVAMPPASAPSPVEVAAPPQPTISSPPSTTPGSVVGTTTTLGNLPTGGIKTAFHMGATEPSKDSAATAPAAKKARQQQEPATVPNAMLSVPSPLGIPTNAIGNLHLAAAQQQQQEQAAAAASGATAAVPRVALPVGVGIRLGGVGGIAPAAAVTSATGNPVVVQSHPAFGIWGGAVGAAGTSVNVSDQAVAERRQRNREHAKRSRVRKKFMLESLQEQVRALQKENQSLRLLVQEHIPGEAMKIISECCTSSPLFAEEDGESESRKLEKADFSLMSSLSTGQQCFVLSDPKLPDNPIVFASPGFYKLTGYESRQVLGRNCRFLQGPATDQRAVEVIRKAVATGSDATVCLLNYKADGTPFWNQFFIAALRDSDNCIVNYVGVQCEIQPEAAAAALEEKVNAVLPLQNREEDNTAMETSA